MHGLHDGIEAVAHAVDDDRVVVLVDDLGRVDLEMKTLDAEGIGLRTRFRMRDGSLLDAMIAMLKRRSDFCLEVKQLISSSDER